MDGASLQEVKQRYDSWWEGTNEEPLFYIIHPTEGADPRAFAGDWMSPQCTGKWSNWQQELVFGQALEIVHQGGAEGHILEAIDFLRRYATITDHAAEGYPFLLPGLGPGCLAAFISDFTQFNGHTIWFELPQPMEWDQLLAIDGRTPSPYAELALKAVGTLAQRLGGTYVIATPDIGTGLDILASLRGANNLLLDTMMCPENIDKLVDVLYELWGNYYEAFSAIVDPVNMGCYAETMRYLSGKPTHISYCDFSAMISPDMFRRWVLPIMEKECERFDGRVVYHLDGPGELAHLDILCGIEKLHAIQWVPGAGNPGGLDEKWYDLYRGIIDSGKKICLSGVGPNPEEGLKRLFAAFPKKEFFVPFTARNRSHAEELMRLRS